MGYFSEMVEDIKQEPWFIPTQPRSDDFLYFRGSSTKSISTYRLVIASYWSLWIAISILGSVGVPIPAPIFGDMDMDMDAKWLIFLTNWSMVLLGTYLWTAWAASLRTDHSRRLLQVVWVLRNCTAVAALVVSILFWCVLFPAIGRTSLTDVHCHAVNSIIVIVDLTVTHVPYYFKHGWMPFAYLVTYLLFSIVYWLAGGTDPEGDHYIYPPLNYEHPSDAAALVLAVVFIVLPMIHSLLYLYNRCLFRRGFWQPTDSDKIPLLPN
jgi:hypothetical protein